MFRVLFICCCWENSLYHHSEIMTCVIAFVKCTAFTGPLWCCKLVTIAWTAFVYLVVHSSPFSGVAGTKIGCVGLWVCMYDPWVVWPFYFFLVSLFLFFFLRGGNIKPWSAGFSVRTCKHTEVVLLIQSLSWVLNLFGLRISLGIPWKQSVPWGFL